MNSVRVPFIRQALEYSNKSPDKDFCFPLSGLKILDVGCGTGILCEPLARLGADVVGIDASPEMINFAKQRQETALADSNLDDIKSIEFLNTTIEGLRESLPNLGNTFDLVVSSEVIEHIDDSQKAEFLENLNFFVDRENSGSLILSTMGRNFKSWFLTVFAAEKILQQVPEGTHDVGKYIESQDLVEKIQGLDQNLKIERVEGMFYNPLTQLWSFQNATDVNYIVHAKYSS